MSGNALRKKKFVATKTKAKIVKFPKKKETTKPSKFLTENQQKTIILEYRERARKIARGILKSWRAIYELDDIDSLVDLSLCEAAKRYDPSREVSFLTFFYYHLKGNLIKNISDSVSRSGLLPPTDKYTFDAHGLEAKLKTLVAAEVTEALVGKDNDSPQELYLREELRALTDKACSKLTKIELEIVKKVCLFDENVNDLAASLGYSRCHLSRMKSRVLEKLKLELSDYYENAGNL